MSQTNTNFKRVKYRNHEPVGWIYAGSFGDNDIYMKNELRRMIDRTTGRVLFEYYDSEKTVEYKTER
jgi:hypothetical protein